MYPLLSITKVTRFFFFVRALVKRIADECDS